MDKLKMKLALRSALVSALAMSSLFLGGCTVIGYSTGASADLDLRYDAESIAEVPMFKTGTVRLRSGFEIVGRLEPDSTAQESASVLIRTPEAGMPGPGLTQRIPADSIEVITVPSYSRGNRGLLIGIGLDIAVLLWLARVIDGPVWSLPAN